jgi:phosphatidylinositol-3-phosphatase
VHLSVRLALSLTLLSCMCAVLLVGCGGSKSKEAEPRVEMAPPGHGSVPATLPGGHLIVIMLENREFDEVVGAKDAPYLNRLVREGAVPSHYFAVRHPSLPNYLALVGGSPFGIESDCSDCSAAGPSLATQFRDAGVSWRAYMGSMPRPCFRGAEAGLYAKKHNPFMYFPSVRSDPALCRDDVPESALAKDLAAGRLPEFAWISPNLCNDAHSCELEAADRYLASLVPKLRRSLGPGGVLVVTFDEGTSNAGCCGAEGGRIATVLVGPQVRPGARVAGSYTQYALLATIEERFGLPRLRKARSAPTLAAAFEPVGARGAWRATRELPNLGTKRRRSAPM